MHYKVVFWVYERTMYLIVKINYYKNKNFHFLQTKAGDSDFNIWVEIGLKVTNFMVNKLLKVFKKGLNRLLTQFPEFRSG